MKDPKRSASQDLLTRTQELLTPVRESITNKLPFVNGKLQLPASCLSLLYRLTKDGNDARFGIFQATRRVPNVLVIDTSTLPMLLPKSWNNSLMPVNGLPLAGSRRL
jgi:hypothetical protein